MKFIDWKQQILEVMNKYGNYASCLVLVYLTIRLIYLIICTIRTRQTRVSWKIAFRLNVMILEEFRKSLIRSTSDREHQTQEGLELSPIEHLNVN